MDQRHEELLRRLALNDEAVVESSLQMYVSDVGGSGLDAKTYALVRLAGLIALQSSVPSYEWSVTAALAAGATDDEVVGVLIALAAVVGVARMNRAALKLATVIGCDLEIPDRR